MEYVVRLADRRESHPCMTHGHGKVIVLPFRDLGRRVDVDASNVTGQQIALRGSQRTVGDDGDLARDGRVHDEGLDRQQVTVDIPPIQERADLVRRLIVGGDRPGFQGSFEGVSGQVTDIVGALQDPL